MIFYINDTEFLTLPDAPPEQPSKPGLTNLVTPNTAQHWPFRLLF